MFALFFSSISSTVSECVAPTTYNVLNDPNFTLSHIQILLRHGARSPLDAYLPRDQRGSWRCDSIDAQSTRVEAIPLTRPRRVRSILDNRFAEYPPNCKLGDLLVEGMQQQLELGASIRKYLVDDIKFLPDTLDPNLMYIRATSYDRTFRSALSFLAGLYEPQTPNEILDIVMGSPSLDSLRPKKDFCKDFADIYNEYFKSDEFVGIYEDTKNVVQPLIQYLNVSEIDFGKLDKICDWVTTMFCNDKYMPDTITSEIVTKCRKYQGTMLFGFFGHSNNTRGIPFSYGFREMFRILDSFTNGESTKKFALLSAHDSTVAALLSAIGYSNELIPPLASHVELELYTHVSTKEYYIRFVLNGEPIPLLLMQGRTLVPLHEFRQMIDPLTLPYCQEMP